MKYVQNKVMIIKSIAENDKELHASAENPELSKVLLLKPGIGQKIVFHALPAARSSAFLIPDMRVHLYYFLCFIPLPANLQPFLTKCCMS